LIIPKIDKAMRETKAKVVYVCNVMTQAGETTGYSASDHVQAIHDHIGKGCVDAIVVQNEPIKQKVRAVYAEENASPVIYDTERLLEMGLEIIEGDIIDHSKPTLRHNTDKIAKLLYSMLGQNSERSGDQYSRGKIMSFASEIKKELTGMEIDTCCMSAELAALVRMNGAISVSKHKYILDIQTENAAIARRIYTLVKALYTLPVELLVRKKMKLKKNNVYIVRMKKGVDELLAELDILHEGFTFVRSISKKYFKKTCCKKSYLRGAFLAG